MDHNFLIEQIEKYTDLDIVDVVETVDQVYATSHFFKIFFNKFNINIVDNYSLHGPMLKRYMSETLPITIEYDFLDFYEKLLDTINEIHETCIICELRDEENFI